MIAIGIDPGLDGALVILDGRDVLHAEITPTVKKDASKKSAPKVKVVKKAPVKKAPAKKAAKKRPARAGAGSR